MDDSSPSRRLLSLDVFRGATIAAMILVNNPGSWSHIYAPLRHAAWHGCTPTDLIFPFFLFIVGVSMAFSMRKYVGRAGATAYVRIARRVAVLFLLGLVLAGVLWKNWDTVRIPGVLQRIALVYLCASLLVLHAKPVVQGGFAVVVLIGYWGMLTMVPGPGGDWGLGPESNIVRAVDRAVIGESHLYSKPTDPEGLLSTLPAIVTTLMGYWCGLALRRDRDRAVVRLVVGGVVAGTAGFVWSRVGLPLNKPLWTSSYVLFTAGVAMLALAGSYWAIDVRGWKRWAKPFEIFGVNAIFVFVASGLVGRLLVATHIGDLTTKQWVYERVFASWLSPVNASLAFAVCTIVLWWGVLALMDKRGWHIRV